jgi:ABC-type lipoprotein export system ATPase subunit
VWTAWRVALGGGEQQRLAVAAAVANEPPLLLADEPTSQLDRANVTRVLELLRDLRDQTGTTVVMATHDPGAAGAMDRTVSIRGGRVGAEAAVASSTRSSVRPDWCSCPPTPWRCSLPAPERW